jgi:hypothetical protein
VIRLGTCQLMLLTKWSSTCSDSGGGRRDGARSKSSDMMMRPSSQPRLGNARPRHKLIMIKILTVTTD